MNSFPSFLTVRRVVAAWLALASLLIGSRCWAGPDLILGLDHPPVTNSAVLVALDFDADGEMDTTYENVSSYEPQGETPYYSVGFFLRNTSHLRFLRGTSQHADFSAGQSVWSGNTIYVSRGEDNYVLLLGYDSALFAGVQWNYFDFVQRNALSFAGGHAFFTNKTEVLIGFRLASRELGTTHFGWVRLTRPDSLFITPFEVAGYDWNPLPNEPIGAGLPPVIPVQSAFTSEGQLRLKWPAAVANWVLESGPTLGPDAVWEPVPDVVGTEHLLEPPEANRFYRLRRP